MIITQYVTENQIFLTSIIFGHPSMKHFTLYYAWQESEDILHQSHVTFSNPEELTEADALKALHELLIGDEFLIPNRIGIPGLDGNTNADEDDDYHVYEDLILSDFPTTDPRSFTQFLESLRTFRIENPEEYW